MISIIAVAVILIIAFYTILYGIDIYKERNYSGAFATMVLALTIVALPVYLLYFKQ